MKIKDILTKLGFKSGDDMTPEQKAAYEAQLAAVQAELDAERQTTPIMNQPQPPAGTTGDVSAQLESQLKPLRDAMGELAKTVQTLAEQSKSEIQRQADAEKAATSKRYTDHVGELLKAGKVTKAEHDELIKPDGEKYKRNTATSDAVDLFCESSARWSTVPGIKPSGETRTLPGGQPSVNPAPVPGSPQEIAALRSEVLQEIKNNMKS
jgi:hypothetical protein